MATGELPGGQKIGCMETLPVSLAVFDFVPTIAFLAGGIFLVRVSRLVCGARCAWLCLAGVVLIFLGGFLKATSKLLITTGLADAHLMGELQFIFAAPGFFLLMLVAIRIARRGRPMQAAPVMAMAVWKIPLLAIMTLSSMALNGILTYVCFQRGQRGAAFAFIVAFLCLVGMGSMASGEQTLARQWTEEGVNAAGQIAFLLGTLLLHRDARARGALHVPAQAVPRTA